MTFIDVGETSPGYGHVINHTYCAGRRALLMAVQAEEECSILTVLNTIGGEETLLAKSERNEAMKSQIKLIIDVTKSPLGAAKIEAFDATGARKPCY